MFFLIESMVQSLLGNVGVVTELVCFEVSLLVDAASYESFIKQNWCYTVHVFDQYESAKVNFPI